MVGRVTLHYFHYPAVKDRISKLVELDIIPYHICLNAPEKTALQLIPPVSNDKAMKAVFIMIVSRILMPHFQFSCSDIITWYKDHKYYEEMSEVVCILSYMNCIYPCPI